MPACGDGLGENAGGWRHLIDIGDAPGAVAVRWRSRSRDRRELYGGGRTSAPARLLRSSADRLVAGLGGGAPGRQQQSDRRPLALHRAVRADDMVDVPRHRGAVRRMGGAVGSGAGEFMPGHRRHRRYLGAARWPAIHRLARSDPLLDRGVTRRGKGGLGLVAGRRHLRRVGAVLQIFGGSDDLWRNRLSVDRAGKSPLAVATASLCRRSRRAGDVHAGPDLECAARLGVVSVPGRSGGGSLQPARAGFDARRRGAVLAAVDMAAVGRVRVRRAAPRTGRQRALAPGMPGGAADHLLHADLVVEPSAVSLGGARLSDAAAAARRRDRPWPVEPTVACGDRGRCRPRCGVRRQRGTVQLAAADDRAISDSARTPASLRSTGPRCAKSSTSGACSIGREWWLQRPDGSMPERSIMP